MRKRATRHAKPDGQMGHVKQVRALILAALVAAGTAAFYFSWLAGLRPAGGDRLVLLPIVVLGIWAASSQGIDLRHRQSSIHVSLTEIPLLIGIIFLSPWQALVAVAVGFLAAYTHARSAWTKLVNNVIWHAGAVAMGIYVYDHALGRAQPTSAWGWGVALITLVVINLVNLALLLVVVALVDVRWRTPPLGMFASQVSASVLLSSAGGLVAVSLISVHTWSIVLFAAIGLGANFAYRGTVVSRQRYANLEKLYEFTRQLGTLTEGREVMTIVMDQARSLLAVERCELVLPLGKSYEGTATRACVAGEEPPTFDSTSPFTLLDTQAMARGALLLDESTVRGDDMLAKAMAERGMKEALVAPLQRDDPTAGHLVVADRAFRHDGFKQSDLRFFEALAANAGVSLRSSRLLEQLRHEAAERQQQAHHDALTGLANRSLFTLRLEEALDHARPGDRLVVMIIDLDGFKEVNDTLGHHTGDGILREVAARLLPLAQGADLVARLGGDEFALLVSRAPSDERIAELADQVIDLISQPMAVEDLLLDVRASLGIAISPQHSTDAGGLLRQADIAMYAAKGTGGGHRSYDKAEDRSTLRRLRLATELRRALAQDDLDIWYQPVVDIGTGAVVGCEALLRWNHDQFGPISPVEFIPVAESAGLIDPITYWVLDRALSQAKKWRELVPELTMAVNLSARTLMNLDLPARIGEVLGHVDIDPGALTLELTESSTLADPVGSERILRGLQDLGVNLSIDDYGTGFSSLSRLKSLPFDELKIDRSFVKEMITDKGDEAIVRSTIELARYLGRKVTAEGVEDRATLQALSSLGCDSAQGFFLARPLPTAQCEAWLMAATSALGEDARVPRLSERAAKQGRPRRARKEADPGQAL